uniref:Aminoacyl-transfer RNA synthetases class-II family profile domain-containing protein n=1 Tax=Acrobeloides nanus TaxID=290746 RepID=A0A914DT05_9BILA
MNRFLVLRDAYGSVQAILPDSKRHQFEEIVKSLNYESVLRIRGVVRNRGKARNPKIKTGDIELEIDDLEVINEAPPVLPLLSDQNALEQTKLKYRYLEFRSEDMQQKFRLRAQVTSRLRHFFEKLGFVEVETPTLSQWTPGGAAEFLVPAAKPNLGRFYTLPQSPQLYKQLLMCGGIDRYFQIARCYRDEATKSDRQPEFTQVDFELSFTSKEKVMQLVEELIKTAWPESLNEYEIFSSPFQRMKYEQAMNDYGTDKPDLRIPWKFENCPKKMASILKTGVEEKENFSARMFIAKGTGRHCTEEPMSVWKKLIEINPHAQPFDIFIPPNQTGFNNWDSDFDTNDLVTKYDIGPDDAVVFCWGETDGVQRTLGFLRNYLADTIGLRKKSGFKFVWIVDFPFFEKKQGNFECLHHPFTAPIKEDEIRLWKMEGLENIIAQHYDLVLNGVELGGGTIRIHDPKLQRHVFEKVLKLPTKHLEPFFEALSYGAPPHGGFALGLDRFIALLSQQGNVHTSIRDVIAFPKTKDGKCFLMNTPNEAPPGTLERYGLQIVKGEEKQNLV